MKVRQRLNTMNHTRFEIHSVTVLSSPSSSAELPLALHSTKSTGLARWEKSKSFPCFPRKVLASPDEPSVLDSVAALVTLRVVLYWNREWEKKKSKVSVYVEVSWSSR